LQTESCQCKVSNSQFSLCNFSLSSQARPHSRRPKNATTTATKHIASCTTVCINSTGTAGCMIGLETVSCRSAQNRQRRTADSRRQIHVTVSPSFLIKHRSKNTPTVRRSWRQGIFRVMPIMRPSALECGDSSPLSWRRFESPPDVATGRKKSGDESPHSREAKSRTDALVPSGGDRSQTENNDQGHDDGIVLGG
jgi:hypothetical protein